MTEKSPPSRRGEATQAALAAANQALAAANAAVEAAARALAMSTGDDQEVRPNRAARRAASAIRRAGSNADPHDPAPDEAAPTDEATSATIPAPPPAPGAPAGEPAAELETSVFEAAEEPLEFPPAQLPTEAGGEVPGHDRRWRSPVDPEPAHDAGAAARVIRQEAEQRDREIELAQRQAAMARFSPMEPARRVAAVPQAEPNGHTVLVVDDEEQVRALTVRILSRYGYDVLEASGVELALELLDSHGSNVDLVLSDVAMPGLSGKDLFRAISRSRPGLPVVFMSGYALGVYAPEGLIEEGVKMLPKPFAQDDLLAFVTEALAGAAAR